MCFETKKLFKGSFFLGLMNKRTVKLVEFAAFLLIIAALLFLPVFADQSRGGVSEGVLEEEENESGESEEAHDESSGHGMEFAITFLYIAIILLIAKL